MDDHHHHPLPPSDVAAAECEDPLRSALEGSVPPDAPAAREGGDSRTPESPAAETEPAREAPLTETGLEASSAAASREAPAVGTTPEAPVVDAISEAPVESAAFDALVGAPGEDALVENAAAGEIEEAPVRDSVGGFDSEIVEAPARVSDGDLGVDSRDEEAFYRVSVEDGVDVRVADTVEAPAMASTEEVSSSLATLAVESFEATLSDSIEPPGSSSMDVKQAASSPPSAMDATPHVIHEKAADLEDDGGCSPKEDSPMAAGSDAPTSAPAATEFQGVELVTLETNLRAEPANSSLGDDDSHAVGLPINGVDVGMQKDVGFGLVDDGDGLKSNVESFDEFPVCNDPVEDAETDPIEDTETDPVEDAGAGPVEDAGTDPVEDAGTDPVEDAGTDPVEDAGIDPVEDAGTDPVEDAGTDPVEDAGTDPVEDAGTDPVVDARNALDSGEAGMVMDTEDGKKEDGWDGEKEAGSSAPSEFGSLAAIKRKRGRPTKAQAQAQTKISTKRKEEEDVCFICFDGGELVLCDRRGCPKAYHPSCVNRDEAFFRSKGKWNCGWHICSNCEKAAQYMCYTCTFSLCKGCQRHSGFLCVRGNRGLCETCMVTVMHIESNQQEIKELAAVDFDDKNNWEYLFKEYWLNLKRKLSLTSAELTKAKNSLKGSLVSSQNEESSDELYDATNDPNVSSDGSSEHVEDSKPAKKKPKKRSRAATKDETSLGSLKMVSSVKKSLPDNAQWASKELLEFVSHMREGDISVLSPFDVQPLLLEYIKRNKLRDPRKKSQIICDSRLKNLFGKARVGHFEMLKLLESHFLIKEEPSQGEESVGGMTDTGIAQMDVDDNFDTSRDGSDKKRKKGKKTDGKNSRANLDEYAAIDVHNVNLIYLKRNLMEALLDDMENFQNKVVGSFVRIRISGSGLKQDMYRLVQVVGTSKAIEPYKTGRRTTDITLEILNLNKTEIILIDSISNQDFSEEECKRLRQSIKCGFISRLTVGEVQEKAKDIQAVRVNDWLETEILRLSHLRDRASEKGHRRELRECVEKLQLLNTPEERARRLQEMPEIHADPNMDPSHESDENDEDPEEKKHDNHLRPRGSSYGRGRGRELFSQGPRKSTWEPSGNVTAKGLSDKGDFISGAIDRTNESSWNQGRGASNYNQQNNQVSASNLDTGSLKLDHEKPVPPPISSPVLPVINESDKIWYYQDPSGKTQGPFSLTQLRKWNTNGYFPADLRIWKNSEKQDDSILLADALTGKFYKDRSHWEPERTFVKSSSTVDGKHNLAVDMLKGQWTGASLRGSDMLKASPNDSWSGQPQPSTRSATSYQGRENLAANTAYRWNTGQNVGSVWTSGGSNGLNSPVQPGNDSSREWERPSSIGTPAMRVVEGWSPHQGNENNSADPPTPTPNPSSSGWAGLPGNVGMGSNVGIGGQQTTAPMGGSKQIISTWAQPSVNPISEVVNDVFNPPTPTPKQTSGGWDNLSNPSSTILQQSTIIDKEPGRLNSNWAQISQNQSGVASALPRNDQVGRSFSPTVEPRQHIGDSLLSKQTPMNQVDFAGQRTASSDSGWESSTSQNSTQLLGSGIPAGLFSGISGAANSNWSGPSAVPTIKPSRWGPALPSTHNQNMSSTPSNNWSSPPIPNNAGWETGISGSNTGAGGTPNQNNSNPGWGTGQHGDVNAVLGQSDSKKMIPGNTHLRGNDSSISANGGWGSATQSNMVWGQVDNNNGNRGQGNSSTGWAPPSLQGNNNGSWEATAQENANAGWGVTAGISNSVSRGSRQIYNENHYSGHSDQGYQSGDHGYRSNRQSWNRSTSGGGWGSSGSQNRGICKYYENGRCMKGANCNYLHN